MNFKNPIFILGCHKSGSSLLRSLFDNHPELFSIPLETHLLYNSGYHINYHFRKRKSNPHLKLENIIENYKKLISEYNNSSDPFSDTNLQGNLNNLESNIQNKLSQFSKNKKIHNLDRNLKTLKIFNHFVEILAEYFGFNERNIRFVEKSVEHTESAQLLEKLYPNAYFIHIIRNPFSNFTSFRKYKTNKNKYPLSKHIIECMKSSNYGLYKNKESIKNYLVVKYEDLIVNPEKEMKKISNFCHISYTDTLITPTVLGTPWNGNSITGNKFKKPTSKNIDKWISEIEPFETHLINKIFKDFNDEFGYTQPTKGRIFIPCKGESIRTYLENRFFYISQIERFVV